MGISVTEQYKTTCSYCGVGCGIVVNKDNKGKVWVVGDKDHPANKGRLCSKGMNLHYVVEDQADRLLYPQMRLSKNHPMQRVDWDTALNRTAAVFRSLIDKFGPDSVGFYVSGQCLTEEYYVVNKLAKAGIGTNNIDTNSRLCMSSAVVGYKKALGEDAVPISYDDIELADCFFITGANPAWCHPILFRRIEAHKAKNPHVKIIVADPRRTQSCSIADLHLPLKPGTDVVLNNAIARVLIENGQVDAAFVSEHTEGFEKLKSVVMATPLKEAAAICGLHENSLIKAAKYIGDAKGFISLWAMGLNQSVIGVNKNLSLLNLSLITGHIGKPGSGPFSLTGQPNAMGGREVGGMANLLPAHRDLTNEAHRKEVADFWGVPFVPEKPGLTATEMFDALNNGRLKAIWIICTNPLVSLPDARKVDQALRKAKFVVVQDISNRADSLEHADVILPAAGWLEKEGTMTNSDRRISYLPKVNKAPGEALPDTDILLRFAKKMQYPGFDFKSAEAVFQEHCRLTQGTNMDISGLSYDYLKTKGTAQWPFKKGDTKGTERLFTDFKFYTPSKKAQLFAIAEHQNLSEPTNQDYPLVLTTGRIRDQWHTMTRTGKVQKLKQHIADAYLEINPKDAENRGVEEGDIVIVKNARGEVRVKALITDSIRPGVVFLPMHWGKKLNSDFRRANNLTQNLVDPISKEPDFKFAAVQVGKYIKPRQKVVIVGAGAAAFKFITEYRSKNSTDEIHVFSNEKYPFYNRVLLPHYISGHLEWDKLEKTTTQEIEELGIKVYRQLGIEAINTSENKVQDATGGWHSYDKLILATGSRANMPKDVSPALPGIFSIRSRFDAEKLCGHLAPSDHVLVVGGGLLGLEVAASLKDIGTQVSVVHRNRRLMDKQLDDLASELLAEVVTEKGFTVHFNDEVMNLFQDKERGLLRIILKSGKTLFVKAIVYAIGTKPNIEIAQNAGIKCRRGVLVDSYLQSNAPDVYAIGEIAEHNAVLNGITAAAEHQAEVLANYLLGDLNSAYDGSLSMNILKFPDIELSSLGQVKVSNDKQEEIIFIDKQQRYYKKCIIENDKLIGAVLLGDKAEFLEFKQLIESGLELSEKRKKLLRSGKTPEKVIGKLLCSCNNVGEGNITKHIDSGTTNFDELCETTGAGSGCGSCKPEVKALLAKHVKA